MEMRRNCRTFQIHLTVQTKYMSITSKQLGALNQAYKHFNEHLFDSTLAECLVTLQRQANTRGYFSPEKFESRDGAARTDEIALNPDHLINRTIPEALSTLVHEQVHLWQHHHGKPGSGRYHNKEWGDKMESIGLMPSSTGGTDGKRTGSSVTHYIIKGGAFERSCDALIKSGLSLDWGSQARENSPRKSKVKYTCPNCQLNLWGKPEAPAMCGDCKTAMTDPGGKRYSSNPVRIPTPAKAKAKPEKQIKTFRRDGETYDAVSIFEVVIGTGVKGSKSKLQKDIRQAKAALKMKSGTGVMHNREDAMKVLNFMRDSA